VKSKMSSRKQNNLTFSTLADTIRRVDTELARQAVRAVNISLTLRNWLIGYYIAEYEQSGADRAKYGARLLEKLTLRLEQDGMVSVAARSLRQYRQFFQVYPGIWRSPSAKSLDHMLPTGIRRTLSAKFKKVPPEVASMDSIQKLSFSHFAELIKIDDDIKLTFYEIECIRGGWSVRELKRQIGRSADRQIGRSAASIMSAPGYQRTRKNSPS